MSRKILCSKHYRDLLKEIIESLERKKNVDPANLRFKASDVGNYEELKRKGFKKLCTHGVIRVVGKDGKRNIYEISYEIYCTIKGEKTSCRVRSRKDVPNYLK